MAGCLTSGYHNKSAGADGQVTTRWRSHTLTLGLNGLVITPYYALSGARPTRRDAAFDLFSYRINKQRTNIYCLRKPLLVELRGDDHYRATRIFCLSLRRQKVPESDVILQAIFKDAAIIRLQRTLTHLTRYVR